MSELAQSANLKSFEAPDEAATLALASRFAACLRAPVLVALRGDLGAGKTAFARGVIRSLPGVAADEDVPSPTFTLVQTYEAEDATAYHFDLYRIEHPAELRELGWDDALDEGIALVEWPDKAGTELPADRIDVDIQIKPGSETRHIQLRTLGGTSGMLEGLDH